MWSFCKRGVRWEGRGRHAVSHYRLEEELAGGTASLLRWKLETGRTHQIRPAPPLSRLVTHSVPPDYYVILETTSRMRSQEIHCW